MSKWFIEHGQVFYRPIAEREGHMVGALHWVNDVYAFESYGHWLTAQDLSEISDLIRNY